MITSANSAPALAVGVLVGGAAAGLAFPPYAHLVVRSVPAGRRDLAWSTISPQAHRLDRVRRARRGHGHRSSVARTGTSPQRTAAPPTAELDLVPVPEIASAAHLRGARRHGKRGVVVLQRHALRHAGINATPARIVYAVCGVASDHLLAASAAAVLFGIFYNSVIAAQGIWSSRVFADHPSAGLAAINSALTIGTLAGPSIAGAAIARFGFRTSLVAAAVIAAALGFCPPGPHAGRCSPRTAVTPRRSARSARPGDADECA